MRRQGRPGAGALGDFQRMDPGPGQGHPESPQLKGRQAYGIQQARFGPPVGPATVSGPGYADLHDRAAP
jgi:hypothetical protein